MNDLFRFMILRSPNRVETDKTILIDGDSKLRQDLRDGARHTSPQTVMSEIAQTFITDSGDFPENSDSLAHGKEFGTIFDELQKTPIPSIDSLETLVRAYLIISNKP
jgi:hypothetical protein